MPDPSPLTPDRLEALLRDLDREAFVAFVADLWGAGGWETGRDGTVVTASKDGGVIRVLVWTDDRTRVERLLGVEAADPDVDAIDAVVTRERDAGSARAVAGTRGAEVLGTAELSDRLLYAIDREDARRLCRAHLGGDVEPRPPPDPEAGAGTIWDVVRPGPVLVAAALLALLVGVGVGLSGGPGGASPGAAGTTGEPPEPAVTAVPTITPVGGHVTTESPTPRDTPTETVAPATGTPGDVRGLRPTGERFEELRANAAAYRDTRTACARTPVELVVTAVGAIRFNDPARNDGLRTVWRLTLTRNVSFGEFEEWITGPVYRPLFSFDAVAFEFPKASPGERSLPVGSRTWRRVALGRNGSVAEYAFRLRYQGVDCWKIERIIPTSLDRTEGTFEQDHADTCSAWEIFRQHYPVTGDPEDAVNCQGEG